GSRRRPRGPRHCSSDVCSSDLGVGGSLAVPLGDFHADANGAGFKASPCHPALEPSPLASAWKSPRGTVRLPPTPNWTRAPCPAAAPAPKREARTRPHTALVPLDIHTSSVAQHMGDRACWSVAYRNVAVWNTLGCFCGRAARTAP